jgi:hypothetical protein
MKSQIIGMHDQLGGSPSNETIANHAVSAIWQAIDIFDIFRSINVVFRYAYTRKYIHILDAVYF